MRIKSYVKRAEERDRLGKYLWSPREVVRPAIPAPTITTSSISSILHRHDIWPSWVCSFEFKTKGFLIEWLVGEDN